jgi:hypothetical protein
MCSALAAAENGKYIGAASRADRIDARLAALKLSKGQHGRVRYSVDDLQPVRVAWRSNSWGGRVRRGQDAILSVTPVATTARRSLGFGSRTGMNNQDVSIFL